MKLLLEYLNTAINNWVPFREITGWNLQQGTDLDVGIMACSPGNSSFRVEFWGIKAQDYSELAYQKGYVDKWGVLNPILYHK
jgi:regulation of enolase protein 1 (concanavalin A-like superfamily)